MVIDSGTSIIQSRKCPRIPSLVVAPQFHMDGLFMSVCIMEFTNHCLGPDQASVIQNREVSLI